MRIDAEAHTAIVKQLGLCINRIRQETTKAKKGNYALACADVLENLVVFGLWVELIVFRQEKEAEHIPTAPAYVPPRVPPKGRRVK